MGFTKEEVLRLAEEMNVRFIRLQFTDIFGVLKNASIPVAQLGSELYSRPPGTCAGLYGNYQPQSASLPLHRRKIGTFMP